MHGDEGRNGNWRWIGDEGMVHGEGERVMEMLQHGDRNGMRTILPRGWAKVVGNGDRGGGRLSSGDSVSFVDNGA